MLTIPTTAAHEYRVLGIDPGTDALGVGVLAIDLITHHVRVCDAHTVFGHQRLQHADTLIETLGHRHTRLVKLSEAFKRVLTHVQPHAIICETPYLGRFPEAFGALTECLSMLRSAVRWYDPALRLQTVDPASAKASIGVSGQSGDKTAIYEALLQLPRLNIASSINTAAMDEHAMDAVLMACYYVKALGYTL
jgi:Holliday junction resolvasome RuvABC endonuclease subunit